MDFSEAEDVAQDARIPALAAIKNKRIDITPS